MKWLSFRGLLGLGSEKYYGLIYLEAGLIYLEAGFKLKICMEFSKYL